MSGPVSDRLPFDALRNHRAALDTYRDEVEELQQANWTGDVIESMRRVRALTELARGRSTDELETLAGLPPRRE